MKKLHTKVKKNLNKNTLTQMPNSFIVKALLFCLQECHSC